MSSKQRAITKTTISLGNFTKGGQQLKQTVREEWEDESVVLPSLPDSLTRLLAKDLNLNPFISIKQ